MWEPSRISDGFPSYKEKHVEIVIRLILVLLTLGQAASGGVAAKTPLEIELYQTEKVPFYYSVRDSNGNFKFEARNWWPLQYDGRTLDELNEAEFRPGHGTVLVDTEKNGNILLICHSGTVDQNPSQCEEFRRYLEPRQFFWKEYIPSEEEQSQMEEIRRERMASTLGWSMRILEGNAPEQSFEVVGISYIPHDIVEDFRADTKSVMDFLADPEYALDSAPWEEAKTSQDTYVILVFCGWGPFTPATESTWGTWSRYGVLLKPK